jgi:hypothetical protein
VTDIEKHEWHEVIDLSDIDDEDEDMTPQEVRAMFTEVLARMGFRTEPDTRLPGGAATTPIIH